MDEYRKEEKRNALLPLETFMANGQVGGSEMSRGLSQVVEWVMKLKLVACVVLTYSVFLSMS